MAIKIRQGGWEDLEHSFCFLISFWKCPHQKKGISIFQSYCFILALTLGCSESLLLHGAVFCWKHLLNNYLFRYKYMYALRQPISATTKKLKPKLWPCLESMLPFGIFCAILYMIFFSGRRQSACNGDCFLPSPTQPASSFTSPSYVPSCMLPWVPPCRIKRMPQAKRFCGPGYFHWTVAIGHMKFSAIIIFIAPFQRQQISKLSKSTCEETRLCKGWPGKTC